MSDEYIAQLIVDELRESCPGPVGCHGCQGWCPKCGTVSHVCDDPECDTHRRDTDVKRELEEAVRTVRSAASACHGIESVLLLEEAGVNHDYRMAIRRAVSDFLYAEKELIKLEEELREIEAPGSSLVPRRSGSKWVPRDR